LTDTVLVIGGYGVFGGRLAMRLVANRALDVIVAGRTASKAAAFCVQNGGRPAQFDVSAADLNAKIAALAPRIIIDAAGPYQAYDEAPYRLAKAAIACGAHYLDLSDDAGFTMGISQLDGAARAAGVSAVSGVSSVPALSSAVAAELIDGLSDVHVIESRILPGNKAPRGRSVIAAILAQAGQPMRMWRGRRWQTVPGWSHRKHAALTIDGTPPIKGRWASFIGAPDLELFPEAFKARSVMFRAGLDLKLMHGGLAAFAKLAQWRVMRSLVPLTGLLKWAADWLEPFGSDRGGMTVQVKGVDHQGGAVDRTWTLIAEDGDGPHIPAIPAAIMVRKILAGEVQVGARAALAEFSLDEAEAELATLKVKMAQTRHDAPLVFQEALGPAFDALPPELRDLHTVLDRRIWTGKARITRGKGLIAGLAALIGGFPAAGENIDVQVVQDADPNGEVWTRFFGKTKFKSHLTRKSNWPAGHIRERFGLMNFEIALEANGETLAYPVTRGWCLGLPLPRFILPQSETVEFVDDKGRANFDVTITMPIGGVVVTYQGWLEPV
jgi:hypothetical protein